MVETKKNKGEIKYAFPLDEFQKDAKRAILEGELVVVNGQAGSGKTSVVAQACLDLLFKKEVKKIWVTRPTVEVGSTLGLLPGAQPYSSKILTPDGWTTMGEIKEGDFVYTSEGKAVKVLGVFEHGERDVYKIKTNLGKETLACDKHLWEVSESNYKRKYNKPKLVNTLYIKDNIFNNYGGLKISIPKNNIIPFSEKQLPIDPYLLGVLLGDGHFSTSSVGFSNIDEDVIKRVKSIVEKDGLQLNKVRNSISYTIACNSENNKPAKSLLLENISTGDIKKYNSIGEALKEIDIKRPTLHSRCKREVEIGGVKYKFIDDAPNSVNPIKNKLIELNLFGKTFYDKTIPEIYKTSSYEQRLELLRGLLDTDGTCTKKGEVVFFTSSPSLKKDVVELVNSLGGKASVRERDRRNEKRFLEGHEVKNNYISFDISIAFEEYPQLFYIERKKVRQKKYSNIHKEFITSVEFNGRENVKCILIDDERHLYITDDYIVTHNTLDDKLDPYLQPVIDAMNKVYPHPEKIKKHLDKKEVEGTAIQFIRGKTIGAGEVLIIDEAQNTTKHQMLALITRIGVGGKIIIVGDTNQKDIKDSFAGLDYMLGMSKVVKDIKVHNLKGNHRSPLVAKILEFEYGKP